MSSHGANEDVSYSYKYLKEEFVSNLDGTTMLEIAAVSAFPPALVVLRQWINLIWSQEQKGLTRDRYAAKTSTRSRLLDLKNLVQTLSVDFVSIVLPTISVLTVLNDWIYACTGIAICLGLILFAFLRRRAYSSPTLTNQERRLGFSRIKCISSFRFVMMLVTCVCILAVDFTIYPRRYAKTEIYGTGLMDLGVGSFVFANGLVSREARDAAHKKRGAILGNSSPLLLIGFARLVLTKGVDYQVHVGEYGVHWNFFFTLAAVALLTTIIRIPAQFCWIFGSVVMIVYQAILLCGLNTYLNSAQRGPSILSLNKEGILSLFGYWGLYLVSVSLGRYLYLIAIQSKEKMDPIEKAKNLPLILASWFFCGIFWFATLFLDAFVENVSRRTCNLTYVMFILAVNFEVIGILALSDLVPGSRSTLLEDVFNENLLASFLLANVLTGLVNLRMETIFAPPLLAYATLSMYLLALVIVMAVIKFFNLRLKFW